MKESYRFNVVVFKGGLQQAKYMEVIQRREHGKLSCMKEEADDCLILHVGHDGENGIKTVLVYSPDSDVFKSLLYHFKESFTVLGSCT